MTFGDAKRLLSSIAPAKVKYLATHARALDDTCLNVKSGREKISRRYC